MLGGHKQISIFLLCVNIPAYKGQVHIETPITFLVKYCALYMLHVTYLHFTRSLYFSGTRALHFFS